MVNLKINGTNIQAPEGETLLQAAKGMGIKIPTLCHHEALSPYGSCRLCVVEIVKRGRGRIVTSCNHPAEEGLDVFTHSDRVLRHRKMLLELLLARCPDVGIIQDMAARMGIEKPRFPEGKNDCILCGLCVRVCAETIGANAISFVNRGIEEDVSAPFDISSESCIGCGACARICPTGAITMEEIEGMMRVKRFRTAKQLHRCPSCQRYYATELHLGWIEDRLGVQGSLAGLCSDCKRARNAQASRLTYAVSKGYDRVNGFDEAS